MHFQSDQLLWSCYRRDHVIGEIIDGVLEFALADLELADVERAEFEKVFTQMDFPKVDVND